MKKIKFVFMTIWRSDLRLRVLIDILLTVLFVMAGVISNLLGAGVWAAQFHGFLAGVFFGYAIFNSMTVFYQERQHADFVAWSAKHVAESIAQTLAHHGISGHVTVESSPFNPQKMN